MISTLLLLKPSLKELQGAGSSMCVARNHFFSLLEGVCPQRPGDELLRGRPYIGDDGQDAVLACRADVISDLTDPVAHPTGSSDGSLGPLWSHGGRLHLNFFCLKIYDYSHRNQTNLLCFLIKCKYQSNRFRINNSMLKWNDLKCGIKLVKSSMSGGAAAPRVMSSMSCLLPSAHPIAEARFILIVRMPLASWLLPSPCPRPP